jgi:3-oxoacyl-ACP reductase-like protein
MKGGKTLAQQEEAKTEESKVEAKVEEAPATTTTEAPAPLAAEASKTDTQNVESIRGNLGSY